MRHLCASRRFAILLAGACVLSVAVPAGWGLGTAGQPSGGSGVSPEVMRLYADAKDAQARGDSKSAISDYRAILAADPKLAPAYNNLGLLYYQLHQYDAAIDVLQRGLRINPDMSASWVLLGSSQVATRKYQDAVRSLKSAIRHSPNDPQTHLLLAQTFLDLGDRSQAVAALETLTEIAPDNQDAWYLLGKTYLQQSQAAFAQVQKINPDSSISRMMSGEIMESMRNYKEALDAYQKAVALDPNNTTAQEPLANVYWELGNWDVARNLFKTQLERDPANCAVRWKAADCLVQQHASSDQALKELDQAIQECGDLMQARVDRARVLLEEGHPDQALPDLLTAEKADPEEPSIHFLLARVYTSKHLTDQAAQERQTYERLKGLAIQKVADRATSVENSQEAPQ
jgi:tetratricopeptide (TPR) repeat protein